MNTGTAMALGILVGVMIVACALIWKARKKDCEYDEMQLKIRAKGYQIGFFTALLLLLALVLLSEMNLLTAVTPGFGALAALILSVTVFAIYCILHDAFLSVRGKAGNYIGLLSIVILTEGFMAIRYAVEGSLLEDGKLTFVGGAPALMVICFLAILITLIVKTIRNRKEAEE